MKVQLEFDLTDRPSRAALRVMIDAIEALENMPERRRDKSDDALAEPVVERGDINVAGAEPAPARANGGDGVDRQEPVARRGRGRNRAAAAPGDTAPSQPPQPPQPPPTDGAAPDEDVSGPDEETEAPHPLGITEGQEGGRKNGGADPFLISPDEARKTAVEHLKTVWKSGNPKIKAEVAQYQKELGLKAFSDCPDERAHEMYRRAVTMMHAIGKSA